MMIYQVHPLHGWHISYNVHQAKDNEARGWKTISEAEFNNRAPLPVEPSAAKEDTVPVSDDLTARYQQKFGKPPHHRMKPETIEAALNDDGA